jgi:hypothetical protein
MSYIMIILIEFLVIIILSLVIKGYAKERRLMNEEFGKHYAEATFKKAEHTDVILQLANAIVEKLSQEMYQGTFKKNKIVKDVCSRFYRELQNKCK